MIAKEKSNKIEQIKIENFESELFISQSQLSKILEERCVLKNESKLCQKKSNISQIKEIFVSWCEKSDVNWLAKIFEYENRAKNSKIS